ncbi:MAG: ComEC/Rec2 family competence protein [Desulfitobacteriia bacterium]|jgi:competence protein ComEC
MNKRNLKIIGVVLFFLIISIATFFDGESAEQVAQTGSSIELADQLEPDILDEEGLPAGSKEEAVLPPTKNPKLKVHFIDVGQGDAILIQSPARKAMLIDAGENKEGPEVVDYIRKQGISKLDIVVGTHPHTDHIGGLDRVIKAFDIGQVVMPNKTHPTQTFKNVLTAIRDKGLKITAAKPGQVLDLGPGVTASVLAPIGNNYEDLNNFSVVIRLTYGETSFLFTGDAESESEADLLAANTGLKATVLKVAHHGSITSTTEEFLDRVKPRYGVIMAGKDNSYDHPHSEILNRLAKAGVKIYRTDKNGTILAVSNGSEIEFYTSR